MSIETGRVPLSKKDRRELSPFFAREMIADFVFGRLDRERTQAVERYLSEHREMEEEIERLRRGMEYARALSGLKISPGILEKIEEPETYASVLLKKSRYEYWPVTVRWGIEAVVVLGTVLILLVAIPWDRALKFGLSPAGREIVLAEVHRPIEERETAAPTPVIEEKPSFDDEDTPSAAGAPASSAVAAAPATRSQAPTQSEPTISVVGETKKPKASEGSLFRGTLAITNLPVTGPRIRDKIVELGGRKAGEVDLGWRKSPTSAYFHFTMPEAKYDELLVFLRDYGVPKIEKERHPRVMPDGIIRLIITVEEAKK